MRDHIANGTCGDKAASERKQAGRLLLQLGQAARRWSETQDRDAALHDVVYTCVEFVPCHSAAIAVTTVRSEELTVQVKAASHPDEFAKLLEIVAHVPVSPGVVAAARRTTGHSPDLAVESRPEFAAFAAAVVSQTEIRASIAFALLLNSELVGVLNMYFARRGDLDCESEQRAAAIADHAAVLIGAEQRVEGPAEQLAEQLQAALASSRVIGAAIGILVERHKITREAAFQKLRTASQHTNLKLALIAERLVFTGDLHEASKANARPVVEGAFADAQRDAGR